MSLGDIETPVVEWQAVDTGSAVVPPLIFHDTDGDGVDEILMVSGGRLQARTSENALRWQSEYLGAQGILGVGHFLDLDLEHLLVYRIGNPCAVFLLDLETGQRVWGSPVFPAETSGFGTSTLRMVDITGDGLLDLVVKPGTYHDRFYAFSFHEGASTEPEENLLWEAPFDGYSNINPFIVADVTGDSLLDVVFLARMDVEILDAATGEHHGEYTNLFSSYNFGGLLARNVDTDPQREIIITGKTSHDVAITVFDALDEAVSWQLEWFPTAGHAIHFPFEFVGDFDGIVGDELVYSLFNDGDDELDETGAAGDHDGVNRPERWSLVVLDAATGELLAQAADLLIIAVLDLDGDEVPELIAKERTAEEATLLDSQESTGTVVVLQLIEGALVEIGRRSDRQLITRPPEIRPEFNQYASHPPVLFHTVDLSQRPLVAHWMDDEVVLESWSMSSGALEIEELSVFPSIQVSGLIPTAHTELTGEEPLPYAVLYATSWLTIMANDEVLGGVETPFSPTEVLAVSPSDVLAVTHGADLAHLHVDTSATVAAAWPDVLTWEGSYQLADVDADEQVELIAIRTPSGSEGHRLERWEWSADHPVWSIPLPAGGTIGSGIFIGDLDGIHGLEIALAYTDPTAPLGETLRIGAWSNAGEALWEVPSQMNTAIRGPLLPIDADGDDVDDLFLTETRQANYLSGLDGSLLHSTALLQWSMFQMEIVADHPQVFLQPGVIPYAISLFSPPFDILWESPIDFSTEGSHQHPCRVDLGDGAFAIAIPNDLGHLRLLDGATGALLWRRILLDGHIIEEAPLIPSPLSSCSTASIGPEGQTAILVTSEDGHLYSLSPTGERYWSLFFGTATASPSIVGSGPSATILLGGQDGVLRGIQQATVDPVSEVWDVAVDARTLPVDPLVDIDEATRNDVLGVGWTPVESAVAYEYRGRTITGGHLSEWQVADLDGVGVITGLNMAVGNLVFVEVRVVGADGRHSVNASSDGVWIIDDDVPPRPEDELEEVEEEDDVTDGEDEWSEDVDAPIDLVEEGVDLTEVDPLPDDGLDGPDEVEEVEEVEEDGSIDGDSAIEPEVEDDSDSSGADDPDEETTAEEFLEEQVEGGDLRRTDPESGCCSIARQPGHPGVTLVLLISSLAWFRKRRRTPGLLVE